MSFRRSDLTKPRFSRRNSFPGAKELWLFVLTLLLAPQGRGEEAWLRVVTERPEMGVGFRVISYAKDTDRAKERAVEALDRVRELNMIFSDYEFDSEVSRLSRSAGSGTFVSVSSDFWKVLNLARDLGRRSDGAFDVTMGSATALWRKARREKRLPEPRLLDLVRSRSGWEFLEMRESDRSVKLTAKNMMLDFGGIAKGYALDEALRVLRQNGFPHSMVSAGGDVALGLAPPDRDGWEISGLRGHESPDGVSPRLELSECGFATSGDFHQFLEIDGVRYSHILDPKTLVGLRPSRRAVVVAADATTADSLATTLCVLGPERGIEIADSEIGVEAVVSEHQGTNEPSVSRTRGYNALFEKGYSRNPSQR